MDKRPCREHGSHIGWKSVTMDPRDLSLLWPRSLTLSPAGPCSLGLPAPRPPPLPCELVAFPHWELGPRSSPSEWELWPTEHRRCELCWFLPQASFSSFFGYPAWLPGEQKFTWPLGLRWAGFRPVPESCNHTHNHHHHHHQWWWFSVTTLWALLLRITGD